MTAPGTSSEHETGFGGPAKEGLAWCTHPITKLCIESVRIGSHPGLGRRLRRHLWAEAAESRPGSPLTSRSRCVKSCLRRAGRLHQIRASGCRGAMHALKCCAGPGRPRGRGCGRTTAAEFRPAPSESSRRMRDAGSGRPPLASATPDANSGGAIIATP